MTDYRMNDALRRLERLHVTLRYIQLWRRFMSDEEFDLHISRAYEDTGNARQVAEYWKKFAEMNGIKLEPEARRYAQPLIVFLPLALGRWIGRSIQRLLRGRRALEPPPVKVTTNSKYICHHPFEYEHTGAGARPAAQMAVCDCGRNAICPVCSYGFGSVPCDCDGITVEREWGWAPGTQDRK